MKRTLCSSSRVGAVSEFYSQNGLVASILAALQRAGSLPPSFPPASSSSSSSTSDMCTPRLNIDDLASLDEFHVGGRPATSHFVGEALRIESHDRVLDVGCGIGGAARFASMTTGCSVVGVDITREYIDAGIMLNQLCGIPDSRVSLRYGSGLELDTVKDLEEGGSFDKAYMLHVGMNVLNKEKLLRSVSKQLKPGGLLGIYDIMKCTSEPLKLPLPWASTEELNACSAPETYRKAVSNAGLKILLEEDRRSFAMATFEKLANARTRAAEAGAKPSPVGLHLLVGADFEMKMRNIALQISKNHLSPVIMIAQKPM